MISSRLRPEIYRVLIHPLISISISVAGVLSAVWLVSANLGVPAPRLITIVAVVLAPVIEAVVGNALYRERAGVLSRVRELLILLGLFYLVLSLVRSGWLASRFDPSYEQLLPVGAVTAAWLAGFFLHNRLRGRESLLRSFHGKHGEQLRHAVIDRQRDMALTVRELRTARGLIGAVFVLLVLLVVFGSLDPLGISVLQSGSGAFVVLALYAVSGTAAVGSLNTFIQEYAANGEGIAVPLRFQRRRSIVAGGMIAVVLVLSFALSRADSILPFEAIAGIFRWIGGLIGRDLEPRFLRAPRLPRPSMRMYLHLLQLLEGVEPRQPPLILRVLMRLLERLFIAVLAAGAAVFILGPLVSAEFRAALKDLRPRAFLARLWDDLKRRLRLLLRVLRLRRRGVEPRRGTDARTPAAAGARAATWKPGIRKRVQMERAVRLFVEITEWGRRHGLRYTRSQVAWEYLMRVAELRPERYQDARTVADVFCEVRFSRHTVASERLRGYVRAAKRITSSE